MILALIGMSNSGKSYWSRKLSQCGFQRICIDDQIEEKLAPELHKMGYAGINGMARWMGRPHERQSKERQQRYLQIEVEAMNEVLDQLRQGVSGDWVIDTTGSVIYTGEDICKALRDLTTVVYIQTPSEILHEMIQRYFRHPKPTIWGDHYQPQKGETPDQTLIRCYPILLEWRAAQYQKYAEIVLDGAEWRNPALTATDFLEKIHQ